MEEADKNNGSAAGKGGDSNDSWALDAMMKNNPKMVAIMNVHKSRTKPSVYSYHGSLSLFDDQDF